MVVGSSLVTKMTLSRALVTSGHATAGAGTAVGAAGAEPDVVAGAVDVVVDEGADELPDGAVGSEALGAAGSAGAAVGAICRA